MEFGIDLALGGGILLVVGALLMGVIAQFVGETRTGFEWLPVAIGAGIGALVASEFIVALQAAGPVWEGLALVPALVGGLIVGFIVDAVTRRMTGGSYLHHPMGA